MIMKYLYWFNGVLAVCAAVSSILVNNLGAALAWVVAIVAWFVCGVLSNDIALLRKELESIISK